jgi:hypothetical protein
MYKTVLEHSDFYFIFLFFCLGCMIPMKSVCLVNLHFDSSYQVRFVSRPILWQAVHHRYAIQMLQRNAVAGTEIVVL